MLHNARVVLICMNGCTCLTSTDGITVESVPVSCPKKKPTHKYVFLCSCIMYNWHRRASVQHKCTSYSIMVTKTKKGFFDSKPKLMDMKGLVRKHGELISSAMLTVFVDVS